MSRYPARVLERPIIRTFLLAALTLTFALPAHALRPYEGTDASVAENGIFELEFGPVGYLKRADQRSWVAPAVVANFGLPNDFELVVEGRLDHALGHDETRYRNAITDTAISIKHVLRQGSLQEGHTGVSVAAECGILTSEWHGESHSGATCAGIASQRFDAVTVHLNAALTRARDGANNRFFGMILEGGSDAEGSVRPITELFTERDNHGSHTRSALIGLIWKKSEALVFDLGLRKARSDGESVAEVRAGLTLSYGGH